MLFAIRVDDGPRVVYCRTENVKRFFQNRASSARRKSKAAHKATLFMWTGLNVYFYAGTLEEIRAKALAFCR